MSHKKQNKNTNNNDIKWQCKDFDSENIDNSFNEEKGSKMTFLFLKADNHYLSQNKSSVKGIRVTKNVKEIKFEGVLGKLGSGARDSGDNGSESIWD